MTRTRRATQAAAMFAAGFLLSGAGVVGIVSSVVFTCIAWVFLLSGVWQLAALRHATIPRAEALPEVSADGTPRAVLDVLDVPIPPGSNGLRQMEWCTCGSQEPSAPVEVDYGGDGTSEAIGWLCPTCRGDRRGAGPESQRRPGDRVATELVANGGWMRAAADGGPATGADTDTFSLKPRTDDVLMIELTLDRLRKSLAEQVEVMNKIVSESDSSSFAYYMSERQAAAYQRAVDQARRTKEHIDTLTRRKEQAQSFVPETRRRIVRDGMSNFEYHIYNPRAFLLCADEHEWNEVRSHSSDEPVLVTCSDCGTNRKCIAPMWGRSYINAHRADEDVHRQIAREEYPGRGVGCTCSLCGDPS